MLVSHFRQAFISPSVSAETKLSPSKFLSLLIQITGAEVRFHLDRVDQEKDTTREKRMIPLTCHLLEHLIGCLSELVDFDPDIILPLRSTLRDAFLSIGAFLQEQFVIVFMFGISH